jgi:drug/metabolite transporter (DMT)-like permease
VSPTAIVLIVVAAFAHAAWNLSAKRAGTGGSVFVWLYVVLSTALLVPVAVVSVVVSGQHPAWSWLPALAGSGLLQVAYYVLLQRGYANGDMSVVYPMARGTGPLLAVLFAVVVLHEHVGPMALVGALAVVAGVFVIGTGQGDPSGDTTSAVAAERRRTGLGYGLVTGITIAAYTLWDANAVTRLGVPPLVELAGGLVVQLAALTPYALVRRSSIGPLRREHGGNAAVIAVLSPLAYVLVLYAMRMAPVALVAPARELSIVIGSIIAWRVLREPRPLRRLSGAAVVLAGVFALALS